MINRKYIEVEALFKSSEEDTFEDLGIKPKEDREIAFEVVPAVIFIDSISGFNTSTYDNVVTVHTNTGSYLVKGNYDFIKALILDN